MFSLEVTMDRHENIFRGWHVSDQPGNDFEEKVFQKIRKKKMQRKIAISSLGAFLLGAVFFISGSLFFPGKNDPLYTRNGPDTRQEVPVTDHVNFAASDRTHNYVIEQVGIIQETGTI